MTNTEREIRGTPEILKLSLKVEVDLENLEKILNESDEILFLGCGSSYHLGTTLSHYVTRYLKRPTRVLIGSEAVTNLESNVIGGKKYAIFSISRSGETTETIIGTEKLKNRGNPVISITCEPDSKLAELGDMKIVSPSREKSLVMTQSFSSILLILVKTFMRLSGLNTSNLEECIEHSEGILKESFELVEKVNLKRFKHFVFLGTGENWGLSNEAALKVKEMSISFAESHSTLDYRHGPKALTGEESLVFIQFTYDDREYAEKLGKELEEFGAGVLTVGPGGDIDVSCALPKGSDVFLRTIPFQVLALEISKLKGVNPDNPEKLTRVVKLE